MERLPPGEAWEDESLREAEGSRRKQREAEGSRVAQVPQKRVQSVSFSDSDAMPSNLTPVYVSQPRGPLGSLKVILLKVTEPAGDIE